MHKLKLPVTIDLDSGSTDRSPQDRWQAMMAGCDVHMLYQTVSEDMAFSIEQTRKWPYAYKDDVKYGPPSFIVDTDDDLFNVSPLNPAFTSLGYKDLNGNELKQGDKIWIRHPQTNEPQLLWADGENVNYALNRRTVDGWRKMMGLAELITVSTEGTKAMVLREMGPEAESKIHMNPNCIDLSEYPRIELAEHPDEVRILWQGSPTHWEDWWTLREPLGRIAKKYPQAKFIIWGVDYPWLVNFIPAEQIEVMPWMDYRLFKLRLSTLGHDISLAPLRPTIFNQSRSAIKFYESSACWKPAATLAQATAAYTEIIEGETGLLFTTPEEFETKLGGLIEDATLRKRLASNAKDWIKTHRDPTTHALAFHERLLDVRAKRLEWPDPPPQKKKKAKNVSKTKHANIRGRKD